MGKRIATLISEEQHEVILGLVEGGFYKSKADVVREAITIFINSVTKQVLKE